MSLSAAQQEVRMGGFGASESGGIVVVEAYDANGKKLKEFTPKAPKKVNGRWELEKMTIRNEQTGAQATISFDLPKD